MKENKESAGLDLPRVEIWAGYLKDEKVQALRIMGEGAV